MPVVIGQTLAGTEAAKFGAGAPLGPIALIAIAALGIVAALFGGKKKDPEPQKIQVRQTVQSRSRVYGRARVTKGVLAELKVQDPTGDGILLVATMIAAHEIDEIEEHRINDEIVRIRESDGAVTYPGVWWDNNRVFLHYHLGADSQVADTFLTAAFPGRWTAAHQLNGITYTVAKLRGVPLEDFSTVYKAGVPEYTAIIRGAKVYDPRESSHDFADPATWEWTQNAALIIMDYLTHADGMRLSPALVHADLATWIEQADLCDEIVPLIGGIETGDGEPRYRLSGIYDFNEQPKDVLAKMLSAIDGRVYLREDNAIVLEVGRFETPQADQTFTDADIISYSGMRRGATKSDLKNEIRATYTSPGHDFYKQEADPWRDETSIDLDGLQTASLDLEWCPSHSQCRRIQKIIAARLNPDWMGTVTVNARGLGALNKRFIKLTIEDLGISEQTFFVNTADIDLLNKGACTFEVVSIDEATYDWDPTEEGNSPEFETPGDWGIVVPEGATEVTITADGAGGGGSGFDGGGGGARTVITVPISPADWGDVIQFTVGRGGMGDPPNIQSSTDGGDTTVTANLVSGSISLFAGGGKSGFNGDAGGIATGGDTNTNGSSASGGDGGQAGSGASENEFPGGGGHEGVDGANGQVTFDWTY